MGQSGVKRRWVKVGLRTLSRERERVWKAYWIQWSNLASLFCQVKQYVYVNCVRCVLSYRLSQKHPVSNTNQLHLSDTNQLMDIQAVRQDTRSTSSPASWRIFFLQLSHFNYLISFKLYLPVSCKKRSRWKVYYKKNMTWKSSPETKFFTYLNLFSASYSAQFFSIYLSSRRYLFWLTTEIKAKYWIGTRWAIDSSGVWMKYSIWWMDVPFEEEPCDWLRRATPSLYQFGGRWQNALGSLSRSLWQHPIEMQIIVVGGAPNPLIGETFFVLLHYFVC